MAGSINDYAVIVNNVAKTIAPKVQTDVRSEYMDYMYKVGNAERIYSDVGVTGLGMGEIISDGGVGSSDAPIQGFSKNYTQMHFTKKVRLTYLSNFFLFEAGAQVAKIKGEVKDKVLDGKDAIEHAKNYFAQSLLAQGWNTSFTWIPLNGVGTPTVVSTLGADAVEYWTLLHPREDGGAVWSNVIVDGVTPSPVFSYNSLLAARRNQAQKKDGRGMPLMSSLDTLVVLSGSSAAQLAKSLKATIEKGILPQATSIFNNAPSTDTFKIVELANYGGLGLSSLMWFMFDSKMVKKEYGFLYIESLATRFEGAVVDGLGNQDVVMNFNSICTMGASDLRGWMASYGDGSTT